MVWRICRCLAHSPYVSVHYYNSDDYRSIVHRFVLGDLVSGDGKEKELGPVLRGCTVR